MSTPNSSEATYCTPADVLIFHDANLVAELCSDSGVPVTAAALITHPVLVASVKRACGEVEMACQVGARYQPADLLALTGVGQRALVGLVADLTYWHLHKRRYPQARADEVAGAADALQLLRDLREGEKIFPILEVAEAGAGIEATPLDQGLAATTMPPVPVSERARRLFGARARDDGRLGSCGF